MAKKREDDLVSVAELQHILPKAESVIQEWLNATMSHDDAISTLSELFTPINRRGDEVREQLSSNPKIRALACKMKVRWDAVAAQQINIRQAHIDMVAHRIGGDCEKVVRSFVASNWRNTAVMRTAGITLGR